MQYLSARQMWHDAFYSRSANDQLLEINRSNANLLRQTPVMNETQTRGPADNGKKIVHMVKAGKVQSAIARLPPHLQAFGMYCWAPRISESSYKNQYKHMQQTLARVKSEHADIYATQTNCVSIVIMQMYKIEYNRAHGRKTQSADIVIAAALCQPKDKIRKIWGPVIKTVRDDIRDQELDADQCAHLDYAAAALYARYLMQTKKPTKQGLRLARLVIKEFAHADQAYMFSAGENKEPINHKGRLFTQDYIARYINIKSSNYCGSSYKHAYDTMMQICHNWSIDALIAVRDIK